MKSALKSNLLWGALFSGINDPYIVSTNTLSFRHQLDPIPINIQNGEMRLSVGNEDDSDYHYLYIRVKSGLTRDASAST